ncbi:MAG: hemerythrin domain-containing protein, partial [Alphaproteobacteria bacterium]
MAYYAHTGLIADNLPDSAEDDATIWLFVDNFRQRRVLNFLRNAADYGALSAPLLRAVSDFLRTDMILHILSEEKDLFPLLRSRCSPEDHLDRLLDRLARDHEAEREAIAQIGNGLRLLPVGAVAAPLSPELRHLITAFVEAMKWHIIDENTLLLPLVRG